MPLPLSVVMYSSCSLHHGLVIIIESLVNQIALQRVGDQGGTDEPQDSAKVCFNEISCGTRHDEWQGEVVACVEIEGSEDRRKWEENVGEAILVQRDLVLKTNGGGGQLWKPGTKVVRPIDHVIGG